ncbi:MAG: hypothetical protein KBT41_03270, partial [bacterium]|nr:hypothetical protein [Candidatus Colousia faecequi]
YKLAGWSFRGLKDHSNTLLNDSFTSHRNGWLSYLMPLASKISQKRANYEVRIFNMPAMAIIWVSH